MSTDAQRMISAPDGQWFATAGSHGEVVLWERWLSGDHGSAVTATRRRLRCPHREVTALAVSPDDTWLAAVSKSPDWFPYARRKGPTLQIWDAATGRERVRTATRTRRTTSLVIAPDGSWLALAGADGKIQVREASTGRHRRDLNGHSEEVTGLAIAPGDRWLASTSADHSVRVWDLTDLRCVAVMRVEQPLLGCTWSPDGGFVVAGGTAGVYRFRFRRPAATPVPENAI